MFSTASSSGWTQGQGVCADVCCSGPPSACQPQDQPGLPGWAEMISEGSLAKWLLELGLGWAEA